jgi:hypothetical protein
MKVENKQDILNRNLKKFYANDTNMKKLVFMIGKDCDVSLREWDFLCTHYAKKHNVLYYNSKKELINLNLNYRSQLKAYSKAHFDPFKRHNRVTIPCKFTPDKEVETTCGQLCFFRFVIEKDMYEWLKKGKNLQDVRVDMTHYTKSKTSNTDDKKRTVSKNNKLVARHDVKITVFF